VEGGLSKAKPGDILCFGTSLSNVGHVGMYVGNNRYIHAPQTGEVVKIEVLSAKRIATCVVVRRGVTSDD
jgi:cell wall-associated NlpC family hydrolase